MYCICRSYSSLKIRHEFRVLAASKWGRFAHNICSFDPVLLRFSEFSLSTKISNNNTNIFWGNWKLQGWAISYSSPTLTYGLEHLPSTLFIKSKKVCNDNFVIKKINVEYMYVCKPTLMCKLYKQSLKCWKLSRTYPL